VTETCDFAINATILRVAQLHAYLQQILVLALCCERKNVPLAAQKNENKRQLRLTGTRHTFGLESEGKVANH
jgi:hypothetical protein